MQTSRARRGLPLLLALAGITPALVVRLSAAHLAPEMGLAIFGVAVLAASFILTWAAEVSQLDISGGLALALVALIAVLPEYAVDAYFAFHAGTDPTYVGLATANMTGANRLLLGVAWPMVLFAAWWAARREGRRETSIELEHDNRTEIGFLLVACIVAFALPLLGSITTWFGLGLAAWFVFYMVRVARKEPEEPHLIGTAEWIATRAATARRRTVVALFIAATVTILLCAEPFAHSLVDTGTDLGIDKFFLVQWVAPFASEAPEFVIVVLLALRGNAPSGLSALVSSKVNQWTLLIGTLPIAYGLGGGSWSGLPLGARQKEEVLLTAAQSLFGVALLLQLRFPRWGAVTLLGLFAVQFVWHDTTGHYVMTAVYIAVSLGLFVRDRATLAGFLRAPFARSVSGATSSS